MFLSPPNCIVSIHASASRAASAVSNPHLPNLAPPRPRWGRSLQTSGGRSPPAPRPIAGAWATRTSRGWPVGAPGWLANRDGPPGRIGGKVRRATPTAKALLAPVPFSVLSSVALLNSMTNETDQDIPQESGEYPLAIDSLFTNSSVVPGPFIHPPSPPFSFLHHAPPKKATPCRCPCRASRIKGRETSEVRAPPGTYCSQKRAKSRCCPSEAPDSSFDLKPLRAELVKKVGRWASWVLGSRTLTFRNLAQTFAHA